jgi:hypothetical protein
MEMLKLKWTKDGVVYVRNSNELHEEKTQVLSPSTVIDFVKFLVENTYVKNGGSVRKQTVGIPMGTNCAPSLANIFLYHYESLYISNLSAKDRAAAARFHMTFRFIDDVLSVDNQKGFRQAISTDCEAGGIYPAYLQLKETTVSENLTQFLGMNIEASGKFHLSVYDKLKDFPFTVIRYPRTDSLIPRTQPYGVFVGQLWRGYRTCNRWQDFIVFSTEVAVRLVKNGCSRSRLNGLFCSFVRLQAQKFVNVGFRKLVKKFEERMGNSL